MKKTYILSIILICSIIYDSTINYIVCSFGLKATSTTIVPGGLFYSYAVENDMGLLYTAPKIMIVISLIMLIVKYFKKEKKD